MKKRALVLAVCGAMPLLVHAAATDRSGQSISPFFQTGNYLEVGYTHLSPEVGGQDKSGNAVPEMARDYEFTSAAMKVDLSDTWSFAWLYDQPYGASAKYQGQNNFVADGNKMVLSSAVQIPNSALGVTGATQVDAESHSITGLLGYKIQPNVTIYGGVAGESTEGTVQLRGPAYSIVSGYNAELSQDTSVGYVLGGAFERPDIALRLAVTYRSEIEHKLRTRESLPLPTAAFAALQSTAYAGLPAAFVQSDATSKLTAVNTALAADPTNATLLTQQAQLKGAVTLATLSQLPSSQDSDTNITSPQSVNVDFQTGIMANTLMFAQVRWVDWTSASIKPALFAQATSVVKAGGLNVVDYSDDQWSATLGVGRKLNPQWSVSGSVGWDSGAGNPITTLGPTEGNTNVGLGVKYTPTPAVDVSVGAKYFWLGDADAKISSGTVVGRFEDNTALAMGVKLGYHF